MYIIFGNDEAATLNLRNKIQIPRETSLRNLTLVVTVTSEVILLIAILKCTSIHTSIYEPICPVQSSNLSYLAHFWF